MTIKIITFLNYEIILSFAFVVEKQVPRGPQCCVHGVSEEMTTELHSLQRGTDIHKPDIVDG
jgi:hypothetical protein